MSMRIWRSLTCVTLLVFGACSDGSVDEPLEEPWKLEEWLGFGIHRYDEPPPVSTSYFDDRSEWFHRVNGAGITKVPESWTSLELLGGEGTMAKLQAMDTPTLRARYAESLTDFYVLRDRIRNSAHITYPVEIFKLGLQHWSEERHTQQIEDPTQNTPLYGAVILPVGSDPAVPDNPELSALIAELMRIHEAWEKKYSP